MFANASSVHETSTAELALALTLAAQRHLRSTCVHRTRTGGRRTSSTSLADRRVLLLGYGGVGKAVAARLAPFEVELTRVARHARVEDGVPVHGVDELPTLLPSAEIVIMTLPGGRGDPAHRRCGVPGRAARRRRCWSTSAAGRWWTPTRSSTTSAAAASAPRWT